MIQHLLSICLVVHATQFAGGNHEQANPSNQPLKKSIVAKKDVNGAKPELESVLIQVDGGKWIDANAMVDVAINYAREHHVPFVFEESSVQVWVERGNLELLAQVVFSHGIGRPSLSVHLNSHGEATGHALAMAMDRVLISPEVARLRSVELRKLEHELQKQLEAAQQSRDDARVKRFAELIELLRRTDQISKSVDAQVPLEGPNQDQGQPVDSD